MKYNLGMQTVEAVYDNSGTQNPLIEALPGCLMWLSLSGKSSAAPHHPKRAKV